MTEKVIPNCRYGHGDLMLVASEEVSRWGLVSERGFNNVFVGKLHVCVQCGYMEFFDDDPQRTAKEFQAK